MKINQFIYRTPRRSSRDEWAKLCFLRKIEPNLTLTELRRRMREQKRQQSL